MVRRRERGIYNFLQKPSDMRLMSGKFRSLVEQGRITEAMQPVNDALELLGYGNYMPDYNISAVDLSPSATIRNTRSSEALWLQKTVEVFNSRVLRLGERVAGHYGYNYIKKHFCPVCWGRPQSVSEKELVDKIAAIAAQVRPDESPSIVLRDYAVTDESYRLYRTSMPVVWMRYSYLRRFKAGLDIINVYRMMKNSERIYDIPRFPYEGIPDFMI